MNCRGRCRIDMCHDSYTLTYAKWMFITDIESKEISVRVGQPSCPFYRIEYYPKNEFYDVFIYICSTLGSWLGLVLIRLDPFIYFGKIKQFCQQKETKKVKSRTIIMNRHYHHYYSGSNMIYDPLIRNPNVRLERLANLTYRE